MKSLTKLQ